MSFFSLVRAGPHEWCRPADPLDRIAPMDAADALRGLPGLAVLETARPGRRNRWTYLAVEPLAVIETPASGPDPFAGARRLMKLDQ